MNKNEYKTYEEVEERISDKTDRGLLLLISWSIALVFIISGTLVFIFSWFQWREQVDFHDNSQGVMAVVESSTEHYYSGEKHSYYNLDVVYKYDGKYYISTIWDIEDDDIMDSMGKLFDFEGQEIKIYVDTRNPQKCDFYNDVTKQPVYPILIFPITGLIVGLYSIKRAVDVGNGKYIVIKSKGHVEFIKRKDIA